MVLDVLPALHAAIAQVCPIHGVSLLEDGSYLICHDDTATATQRVQAQLVIDGWPLALAKLTKLASLEADWVAVEKLGWDSGLGYSLGITAGDVALLVGVFTLAKEASAMGLPLPAIIAMDNTAITFATMQEMTVLMLRYGAERAQLSSTWAARRLAVRQAQDAQGVADA